MRNEYKNFFGGLTADLDVERQDDFVNQVTYNPEGLFDFLDDDDIKLGGTNPTSTGTGISSILDVDQDGIPDMIDIDAGSGTGQPTTNVAPAPRANKGAGLGAFAQGLGKGLGLFQQGQQPVNLQQQGGGTADNQADQAGFLNESPNPWIPIMIGGIGIAVIVFAINAMKQRKETTISVSAPTQTPNTTSVTPPRTA